MVENNDIFTLVGNSMNSTNNLMSSINSSSLFNELEESFRHNNQDQVTITL